MVWLEVRGIEPPGTLRLPAMPTHAVPHPCTGPGDGVAGVGVAAGVFLKPGDTIKMTVEGLGVLENPVVAV